MPSRNAIAQFELGKSLEAAGNFPDAIVAYQRAVKPHADFHEAYLRLGNALAMNGQHDEAAKAYRHILKYHPNHGDTLSNLGNTLYFSRQFEEAVRTYHRVLTLYPNHLVAQSNLAAALVSLGEYQQAATCAQRAVAIQPNHGPAWNNLGDAQSGLSDWTGAANSYKRVLDLYNADPRTTPAAAAEGHIKLAAVLNRLNQLQQAVPLLQRAIAIVPSKFEPRECLVNIFEDHGLLDEALQVSQQNQQLFPNHSKAASNLGGVLLERGDLDGAMTAFSRAADVPPGDPAAFSIKIFITLFHPAFGSAQQLAAAKEWEQRFAPRTPPAPHRNDKNPDRRLRIGYISQDFRDHVVGRNMLPLFQHHDRSQFEIFCYNSTSLSDRFNTAFRKLANQWREIAAIRDDDVAELIRRDEIDLLIDTSLHLGGNRLGVMARKPAPVQLTFFGYPGTTGLSAIDYRLTDPYLDPPGMHDADYSEQSIRLPHSFWCYDPAAMEVADWPEPGPPPMLSAGHVTFGCLNNFRKINDTALQLWANVLSQVSNSRMRILAARGGHRTALSNRFVELGITPDRISFIDRGDRRHYLNAYTPVDIALDTVPYNGHTTSLDALWLGIPVVTLVGRTVAGRAGVSQASNMQLTELVADTPEQFASIAVSLAEDPLRLAAIRSQLRNRMWESPLCQPVPWAKAIEAIYREAWQKWCGA
jgi:predicted O-linked N-acetylglucosamine transferase (SPINDLY family)